MSTSQVIYCDICESFPADAKVSVPDQGLNGCQYDVCETHRAYLEGLFVNKDSQTAILDPAQPAVEVPANVPVAVKPLPAQPASAVGT